MADRWSLPSGSVGEERFRVWPESTDSYDHIELAANWDHLDGIIGAPPSGTWPPTEGINGGIYKLIKDLTDRIDELEDHTHDDEDDPVLVIDDKYIIGYGTVFPASPPVGKHFVLVDHLTNPTWQWHCRYIASGGSYPWVVVGATPIISKSATQQNIDTASALSISFPKNGQYYVQAGGNVEWSQPAFTQHHFWIWAGSGGQGDAGLFTSTPLNVTNQGGATIVSPVTAHSGTSVSHTTSVSGGGSLIYGRVSNRWIKAWPRRLAA